MPSRSSISKAAAQEAKSRSSAKDAPRVMQSERIRISWSTVIAPPQVPLGQRSSSYSHASRPSFPASSAQALISENHSSPIYCVARPVRECMKNPPKPIC